MGQETSEQMVNKIKWDERSNIKYNSGGVTLQPKPFPGIISEIKYFSRSNIFSVLQAEFRHIMKNLPAPVYDSQIEDMWNIADTDKDGRLSYQEFCVSLLPPENYKPAERLRSREIKSWFGRLVVVVVVVLRWNN